MNRPGALRPTDSLFDDLHLDELRRRPGVKWQRVDPDVLPAWVADMDFAVPQVVADAIEHTVRRGDLGYPSWQDGNPLRDGLRRPDAGAVRLDGVGGRRP